MSSRPRLSPRPACKSKNVETFRPMQTAMNDYRHVRCLDCGACGPTAQGRANAEHAWDDMPRGCGPQTQAVLDELISDMKSSDDETVNGYAYVFLDASEREAFFKEQGVQ